MKIIDVGDDEIDKLIEKGGLKAETLQRRKAILEAFKKYIAEKDLAFEEVLKEYEPLENHMLKFLEGYRVQDKKDKTKDIRPKDSYFLFIKSNLTVALEDLSGFNFSESR